MGPGNELTGLQELGGGACQDSLADDGVLPHHFPLVFIERAGLEQDGVRDPELADVVQTAGVKNQLHFTGGQLEAARHDRRVCAHPLNVTRRVRVFVFVTVQALWNVGTDFVLVPFAVISYALGDEAGAHEAIAA